MSYQARLPSVAVIRRKLGLVGIVSVVFFSRSCRQGARGEIRHDFSRKARFAHMFVSVASMHVAILGLDS